MRPGLLDRRAASAAMVVLGVSFSAAAWLLPGFDVTYQGEGMHIALEAIQATVYLVVGGLAWARYSRTKLISDLAVALVFGVVLAIQSTFLLALPTLLHYGKIQPFSVWSSAVTTVLAPLLLLAGLSARDRVIVRPRLAFAAAVAVVLAVVIAALVVLAFERRLPVPLDPQLSPVFPRRAFLTGGATLLILEALVGAMLLVAGAQFVIVRGPEEQPLLGWIGPALLASGFAALNYALFPSLYSYWVFAGDELQLVSCFLLAWGVVVELRAAGRRTVELAVLEERRRLARDLHDGVAQELAYIAAELADLPADAGSSLRWIRAAAERGLHESRRAIAALTMPLDASLTSTITAAVEEIAGRGGTAVRFELDDSVVVTPAKQEVMLRVVSEAATNAIRHGQASTIRVALSSGPGGSTQLEIADDGVGLPSGAESNGFGLTSMRERVAASGGILTVTSVDGGGTIVEARWGGWR